MTSGSVSVKRILLLLASVALAATVAVAVKIYGGRCLEDRRAARARRQADADMLARARKAQQDFIDQDKRRIAAVRKRIAEMESEIKDLEAGRKSADRAAAGDLDAKIEKLKGEVGDWRRIMSRLEDSVRQRERRLSEMPEKLPD
jgi:septal ring factor EnvC (AmiA/AmiB activator)